MEDELTAQDITKIGIDDLDRLMRLVVSDDTKWKNCRLMIGMR